MDDRRVRWNRIGDGDGDGDGDGMDRIRDGDGDGEDKKFVQRLWKYNRYPLKGLSLSNNCN